MSCSQAPPPPPPPTKPPSFRSLLDRSCGTLAASLCEDSGCYDPGTGDYDVVIPADQEEGQYTLEVINVDDQTLGCLESPFDIVIGNDSSPTLAPLQSPMPSPAPRSVAATVVPTGAVTPAPTDGAVTPSPTDGTSTTLAPSAFLTPIPTAGAPTPVPSAAAAALTPIPTAGATTPTPTAATPTPQPSPAAPTPSPVMPTAITSSDSEGTPGSPGTPPSPVPAKVECDPDAELEFVYTQEDDTDLPLITVAHASGDRSEAGCLTLTKVYEWLGSGPAGVAGVREDARAEFVAFFRNYALCVKEDENRRSIVIEFQCCFLFIILLSHRRFLFSACFCFCFIIPG